jgi:hypothetical protein
MGQFLTIVRDSFEMEIRALQGKAWPNRKVQDNPAANYIPFASLEITYACLIRRALVLSDFNCDFRFEMRYPDSNEYADLVLYIPDGRRVLKVVVEIKWIHTRKDWGCVAMDGRKVLRGDFDRRFLLVFPVYDWTNEPNCEPVSEELAKSLTQELNDDPGSVSVSLACQRKFVAWSEDGKEVSFGLSLYEVGKTKHLPALELRLDGNVSS